MDPKNFGPQPDFEFDVVSLKPGSSPKARILSLKKRHGFHSCHVLELWAWIHVSLDFAYQRLGAGL